jgi:hypothetical protein
VKTNAPLSAACVLAATAFSLWAAGPLACSAAPLTATAAVQTQPDPSSPIISYLKAGSEPVPATAAQDVAPGWMAVELTGPFEGYVLDKDFTKGLDVKPGSPVYLAPKPDAGVLTIAAKGDKTEITGLYGKWTQVRLDRNLVGYIQVASAPPPAVDLAAPPAAAPLAASGSAAPATAAAGSAAPGGEEASLPRVLEGKFESTRRPFAPRRPYDWEIVDASGSRLAYLDLSKLLLTEQLATYVDKVVVVTGAMAPAPGARDFVIAVESLQLK